MQRLTHQLATRAHWGIFATLDEAERDLKQQTVEEDFLCIRFTAIGYLTTIFWKAVLQVLEGRAWMDPRCVS